MQRLSNRLLSIDVLRALTMFLMIFVNDASGVTNIPEWIDHAPGNADAMGFADTIFPAFLFILGLSLPFAINNRIKKGESFSKILLYILGRSAALLIMGFFHVNMERYNDVAALIPVPAWAIIVTTAFFLIWLDYPDTINKSKKYSLIGVGIVLLIAMAAIYKGGNPEHPTWMRTSWWGILGIIGWSYLICACIYLVGKGRLSVLVIFLVIFTGINIAEHTHLLTDKIWMLGDGSAVTLTMGGVVISRLYNYFAERYSKSSFSIFLIITGLLLISAGLFIRNYTEGISKIRSTPAWVFICAGITILMFQLFIYIVDIKGNKDFLKIIRPAGTSTLTCYLLPYYQVYILKLFHIKYGYAINNGALGLIRAFAVAFILVWIAGQLEKKKLRIKI